VSREIALDAIFFLAAEGRVGEDHVHAVGGGVGDGGAGERVVVAEQRRIVAKVDELMSLCDQLEASLAAAATDRARLLESLLHEALAPAAA
jgi:hypothetical protein